MEVGGVRVRSVAIRNKMIEGDAVQELGEEYFGWMEFSVTEVGKHGENDQMES